MTASFVRFLRRANRVALRLAVRFTWFISYVALLAQMGPTEGYALWVFYCTVVLLMYLMTGAVYLQLRYDFPQPIARRLPRGPVLTALFSGGSLLLWPVWAVKLRNAPSSS